MTGAEAFALLATHGSRCEGARAVAAHGDRSALAPLLRAWLAAGESEGVCILEAVRALGPVLAGLFPDDALLPLLEPALTDADAEVRRHALRALPLQLRTPGWEALLARQSASPDPAVRAAATALLAERRADVARASR